MPSRWDVPDDADDELVLLVAGGDALMPFAAFVPRGTETHEVPDSLEINSRIRGLEFERTRDLDRDFKLPVFRRIGGPGQ